MYEVSAGSGGRLGPPRGCLAWLPLPLSLANTRERNIPAQGILRQRRTGCSCHNLNGHCAWRSRSAGRIASRPKGCQRSNQASSIEVNTDDETGSAEVYALQLPFDTPQRSRPPRRDAHGKTHGQGGLRVESSVLKLTASDDAQVGKTGEQVEERVLDVLVRLETEAHEQKLQNDTKALEDSDCAAAKQLRALSYCAITL
eukprot:1858088-Prymnesium_polylepis.1